MRHAHVNILSKQTNLEESKLLDALHSATRCEMPYTTLHWMPIKLNANYSGLVSVGP